MITKTRGNQDGARMGARVEGCGPCGGSLGVKGLVILVELFSKECF